MFNFDINTFQKMMAAGTGGGGDEQTEWEPPEGSWDSEYQTDLDTYESDLLSESTSWSDTQADIDAMQFDYQNSSLGDPAASGVSENIFLWITDNWGIEAGAAFLEDETAFTTEYDFFLPEYDPSEMDTLTGRFDTQKANLTEGYDVWLAGETAVHEMATSQAQESYDLKEARGKKTFEEQVDQVARQKDQALASAKKQARSATAQIGKAGIARGASITPQQAKMDSYSDSMALINTAETKLRTEYKQGVEEMKSAFDDQQELATVGFENAIESQLNSLFNNLENLGLDFEAGALEIETDYWESLMQNLSTIVMTDAFAGSYGEDWGVEVGVPDEGE